MGENECEECDFELFNPEAQFMFSAVKRCSNCGNVERQETVEHKGLPSQVRELIEE